MKRLIILVGPKGSGKTYIGTLLERNLHIPFFRVEDLWLSLKLDSNQPDYIEKGFVEVEKEIDNQFKDKEQLTIESIAAFDYFNIFLTSLKSKYVVKLIRIKAPMDLCLKRVKTRDQTIHIPVSDDRVNEINKLAEIDFDLVIDNENKAEKEIIDLILPLLKD